MKAYSTPKRNSTMLIARRAAPLRLIAAPVLSAALLLAGIPPCAAVGANVLSVIVDKNAPASAAATAATAQEIRADLDQKLNEALAFRDRLDSGSIDTKPPEGIKPEEVTEQRRIIESLLFFYQEGLTSLATVESERDKLKLAEAQAQEWTDFTEPPPYSMLMLYGLQEEADALRGKQAVLESLLAGWQGDSALLQAEVSRAQAAARQAAENVERAASPGDSERAVWRRDFAGWRVRASERNVWFKEIQTALVSVKLAVVRAELALLEKKITVASRHAVLSEADMEKVREGLKAANQNLQLELQKAVAENTRWTKERAASARILDTARAENNKEAIETLTARLRAADTWVAATSQEIETLGTLSVINNNIEEYWNYQYMLLNSLEPKLQHNALQQLQRDLARLRQWGSYTQDNLRLAVSEESNQQAKLDSISLDSPLRRYEAQTLEAYRLKRQTAERIRLLADRTALMLTRWLDNYHRSYEDKPIEERVKIRMLDAAIKVEQIFGYELLIVDDEVDLEGKKVKISRGVTLGKLLTALAVFVVGFWIAKWLSRRFQRMLVAQFGIDEAQSNVLRRWVLMGFSLILLVTVLTMARIPLTAFAFLGGALAIGVGFGTQTMLKNLISGVMILLERKIKVGDIVEVDSIVGTITEIDIRSSTVRGFDGVETMIPNSTFLENKVTNWTYTSLKVRRCVRVGVAYGSPVREVIQLLLDCASRHGQVLNDPKPYVWLEDFGENSLVFGLYFWLEMGPKVSALQMMSDLRCMMIDALGKSGIAIPFPQRDIHFAPSQPVPVSVVEGGAAISNRQAGTAD
jgi:potassium efflux system protein